MRFRSFSFNGFLRGGAAKIIWHGRLPGVKTRKRSLCNWWKEHLCPDPVYSPMKFRHKFRIPLNIYITVRDRLVVEDPRFVQSSNAAFQEVHTSNQKTLAAFLRLGTCHPFQYIDNQTKMSPESCRFYFNNVYDYTTCVRSMRPRSGAQHGGVAAFPYWIRKTMVPWFMGFS